MIDMRYFSGFSLNGEQELFRDFLVDGEFTVAGFSYGAIRAFEYALDAIERVDRLILISPAFFQNMGELFIRAQLRHFKLNRDRYIQNFLKNVAYPSDIELNRYLKVGAYSELESLLRYNWSLDRLMELKGRGITIEVFLGDMDRVIDIDEALKLFSRVSTTYLLKGRGHILR